MPTEVNTAHPTSLKDVESIFDQWMGHLPGRISAQIHLSHGSGKTHQMLRLLMSIQAMKRVKFGLTKEVFFCAFEKRKMSLPLGGFDVRTEMNGEHVLVEFKVKQSPTLKTLSNALDSAATTKYPVFYSRALNALTDLTEELSPQGIDEVTTAPTDFLVLVNALTASPIAPQLAASDPLAAAKLRGIERQRQVIEHAGGVFNAEEVAKFLGITRQAVDKRRAQGQLIGLTQGRRGYAYPVFQFEDGRTLQGLERVLDALRDHDPWMQLIFFVNGNDRLGGESPIAILRAGRVDAVTLAAESYGEQGAA